MPLECIVFDCDGVLLDSVPTKTRAFARLAEPYGEEARDRFVLYHRLHGGVSRFPKFAWFFREVLDREIEPEESRRWGELFQDYALEEVKRCPLIPGALRVLERWSGRLPMYVCSGTPTPELKEVLALRGLDGHFRDMLGSPPAKSELLASVVRREGLDPRDVLMVGDASTDREAADHAGTLFYGCGPELRTDSLFPWSETLEALAAWIAAHVD